MFISGVFDNSEGGIKMASKQPMFYYKSDAGKGRPRARQFDCKVEVNLPVEDKAKIAEIASEFNLSHAEVVRLCLKRSLPKLRQSLSTRRERYGYLRA